MTAEDTLREIDGKKLRLVLLPSTAETFQTVKLDTVSGPQEFLVAEQGGQIYSLNKTDFKDPYDAKQLLTKQQKPIKSLLLTRHDGDAEDDCLIIGKDPELYVATRYNPAYLLLQHFIAFLQQETTRLLPYDDLLEQLEADETIAKVINAKVAIDDALKSVCETAEENDETFYKPSLDKATTFLKEAVSRIVDHFPASIEAHLQKKLHRRDLDSDEIQAKLVPEVETLARQDAALGLLSSYVDEFYLAELRKQYDFTALEDYWNELKRLDNRAKIAEENLAALNESLHNGNGKGNGNGKRKKPAKAKKEVKKVASGKGALDMFFKRK